MYVSQARKLSRYLLLAVNVSSWQLISVIISIVSIQDPVHCLKGLFRVHSGRFLSYLKKRKISQKNHSLSFVVTFCHLLSFVVIRCRSLSLIVICCHSLSLVVPLIVFRCHSLSFIVTRCNTCCHWLSLDVSLVCLFINDFLLQNNSGGCFWMISSPCKVTSITYQYFTIKAW